MVISSQLLSATKISFPFIEFIEHSFYFYYTFGVICRGPIFHMVIKLKIYSILYDVREVQLCEDRFYV